MNAWIIILTIIAYLSTLFGIAYIAEKLSGKGKNFVKNPLIYALSLAVYCTAWTFYGSVGFATRTGIGFLAIYLGPTLMAPLWYIILRKIIVISNSQRITSLSDFISSRYGKSTFLGGLVAFITLVGIIPYVSLQLKAVSTSFDIIQTGHGGLSNFLGGEYFYQDTAFYIAIILAIFIILFGTRHLETSRQNYGLVAVVAFESIIKLIAFLAVGIFVTYFLYNGFGDLFQKAASFPDLSRIYQSPEEIISPWYWFFLITISMFAIIFLPRQFHISVVENTDLKHVKTAIWLFPLYLFVINIFVLPIAFGGTMLLDSAVEPDTYVLTLPLSYDNKLLALFVFLGGLSAATGMVIVATLSLSLMLTNNLVLPLLLRTKIAKDNQIEDISSRVKGIRRIIIIVVMMLAYSYYHVISFRATLVSIGLMSFVAVAQFAPVVLGGLFWKRGNKAGAITGLMAGFIIWAFTLPLPSLAESGIIHDGFLQNGAFGLSFLKPYEFLGMKGMDQISHAVFWSLLINTTSYIVVSLNTSQSALEHTQSNLFVDIFKHASPTGNQPRVWRGKALLADIELLLNRFLGKNRTAFLLRSYAKGRGIDLEKVAEIDADMLIYTENALAGAIGAASSRLLISSVVKEEHISLSEVMEAMDETQQLHTYSNSLKKKSRELEKATKNLRAANEQLQELGRVKNDFITTVTHELRTPITSIKSLSHILQDKEGLPEEKRKEFLSIIVKESDRISRLINQVLDLEKMETGHAIWNYSRVDMVEIVESSLNSLRQTIQDQNISLKESLPKSISPCFADRDRMIQVIVNLVSNAIKFCNKANGIIEVSLQEKEGKILLKVRDNGVGISSEDQPFIFQKFTQFTDYKTGRTQGSGLGLSISSRIVAHHGGNITLVSKKNHGALFSVTMPLRENINEPESQPT